MLEDKLIRDGMQKSDDDEEDGRSFSGVDVFE
jgi:hypothetical protein